ncbi:MAG: uroporphyrinogen-III synthase [Candidatus Verstraetearchaeota archaeon]|nr:uroporphyrinogen-III synthase [Candidatus Verstraetearchaeota archaeon]
MRPKRLLITSVSQINPVPFREIGYEPLRASTVRIIPDLNEIKRFSLAILNGAYDSAAFLSPRSIGLLKSEPALLAAFSKMRVYAVGPSTKRSLEDCDIQVAGLPLEYTGEALGRLIAVEHSRAPFRRLAIIRSSLADSSLAVRLRAYGVPAEEFKIYRGVVDAEGIMKFVEELKKGVEVAVFTSRSSSLLMLEYLRSQGTDEEFIFALKGIRTIAFGPEAASGLRIAGVASEILSIHSIDGLISYLKGDKNEQQKDRCNISRTRK